MILLFASLFITNPLPLDMPRAESFLIREGDRQFLEDRYNRMDLWISQAVLGRWMDDDGRVFTLSKLDCEPPAIEQDASETRMDYAKGRVMFDCRKVLRHGNEATDAFGNAIAILSPIEPEKCGVPPRQVPHGFADVDYWHGTNSSAIVCTFLPEKSKAWYMASWELADGDAHADMLKRFEDDFLRDFGKLIDKGQLWVGGDKEPSDEREALRLAAHHSITNYVEWHWTDANEFTVIDNLASHREIIASLTNEFCVMRKKYSEALPTSIDGSNALCVARIYNSREEYLDALEIDDATNMMWSAAYWSPLRRELVAYLPEAGADELLKTIRHESFHQYLSYATSMIAVSPWLNEGYAQYFEDEARRDWGLMIDVDDLARLIPSILSMDYEAFYGGSDFERRLKYKLAWSIAVFIENGAAKVRLEPFKNVKRNYFEELLKSQNMQRATSAAFGDQPALDLFIAEWKKFWKNTSVD